MTDRTFLFERLLYARYDEVSSYGCLPFPNYKYIKSVELPPHNLTCIELTIVADKDSCNDNRYDRLFARAWFSTLLDKHDLNICVKIAHDNGYKKLKGSMDEDVINHKPYVLRTNSSAKKSYEALVHYPTEQKLYREALPEEVKLLEDGYDWSKNGVTKMGKPIFRDWLGRVMEYAEDALYEWIPIVREETWRRYPLNPKTTPV